VTSDPTPRIPVSIGILGVEMLRLRDGQATVWEELLPEQVRLLSPELEAIDALLDDERFLRPFIERFWCPIGRPTIPIESYLRLMYLKHRHGLGYETLCKEVADSISWRRFCRIGLDRPVPHPTTLSKLTRRFGPEIVGELNRALLEAAVERKLLRSRRLRVDTTCIEADVRYPTDSGLCAHAVSRLARAVGGVKRAGLATRTRFRDRCRAAGIRVRRVSHALGRRGSREAIDRLTGELHEIARRAHADAARVLRSARRALRAGGGRGQAQTCRLAEELDRVGRLIDQTAIRLSGQRTIADRMISLSDPDARPIRRGKPGRPTEFGYKVSLADTPEGFVASHRVYAGNPYDADTLEAAIRGAQEVGMRVKTVLADRGYGNEVAALALARRGIADRVIPRVGRADPIERTRAWRRRYRFRAGSEGRISALKRRRGWARSRLKGHAGAQTWAGHGVFTHNLDRMAALT
jgi:IS5 family transposase